MHIVIVNLRIHDYHFTVHIRFLAEIVSSHRVTRVEFEVCLLILQEPLDYVREYPENAALFHFQDPFLRLYYVVVQKLEYIFIRNLISYFKCNKKRRNKVIFVLLEIVTMTYLSIIKICQSLLIIHHLEYQPLTR